MRHEGVALWTLAAAGALRDRVLRDAGAWLALADVARGSGLGGRLEELRGRSVLVATSDQLTAALALLELDGVARRLVLCPPDLPAAHVAAVMATAEVDLVVSDRPDPAGVTCRTELSALAGPRVFGEDTEWVLLTSGTTGVPRLVAHTLASLTEPITRDDALAHPVVWSTFYDIRRYGGLQILLRALIGGGSLILSDARESTGEFLTRAGAHGVTHISGTPSHWRRALMSPFASRIAPRYVRLSGEIADQAILDHLRAVYPRATVTHAFASTEAGVAFAVNDGRAGFPTTLIQEPQGPVEMKIEDGSLRIRSARTATRYLGDGAPSLKDPDGFVDTGDVVERRGGRFHFVGRRGGIINVGGLKVHPEEVEAVINGHPHVRMSRVRTRKSPITGALVVADVVLRGDAAVNGRASELAGELLALCRRELPRHKVPAAIAFVPTLTVAPSGKLARTDA
jgi:acyl-coenzyme A synthetase/AMP-(fatty) acid ligase